MAKHAARSAWVSPPRLPRLSPGLRQRISSRAHARIFECWRGWLALAIAFVWLGMGTIVLLILKVPQQFGALTATAASGVLAASAILIFSRVAGPVYQREFFAELVARGRCRECGGDRRGRSGEICPNCVEVRSNFD